MEEIEITGLPTASDIDGATDLFFVYDASASRLESITRAVMLGITGSPVGTSDSQTLTNKTLTSPTISNPTFSGTLSGTYTIGGTPTFPSSVATLTGSQTLTNKTLTSPTINTPTITNPTITTDSIAEFTGANGVTIDGLNLKDGKLNTNNSVVTNNITDAAVTPNKMDFGSQANTVATSETTSSTSYTDLATSGPAVTATVPASGRILVMLSGTLTNNGAARETYMGVTLSGANTVAAGDTRCLRIDGQVSGEGMRASTAILYTGLSAGSTTFTAKYRVSAGTGTYANRDILAIPIGD